MGIIMDMQVEVIVAAGVEVGASGVEVQMTTDLRWDVKAHCKDLGCKDGKRVHRECVSC